MAKGLWLIVKLNWFEFLLYKSPSFHPESSVKPAASNRVSHQRKGCVCVHVCKQGNRLHSVVGPLQCQAEVKKNRAHTVAEQGCRGGRKDTQNVASTFMRTLGTGSIYPPYQREERPQWSPVLFHWPFLACKDSFNANLLFC